MKPLELRIKGLNSFRAEQAIDFRRLGEYSLFGIFGPTGSGKSSILDAIILALYGAVPRAGSGAAGTINQMEDSAEVSFRFELNAAEGRQEYLIQRRYRRDKNNPDSSHFVSGRLSRVTDADIEVLASKDSELKSKIVELLGLSAQDFTRAVVLPQGRFAEFLAIKGRERTDMLERIFALEQFGERLNRNLKNRLEASASAMKILASEMNGIGDASNNALETAKSAMEQTLEETAAAEEEEKAARSHFETQRRVWELQAALEEVRANLDLLQARSDEIERIRQMADHARRAEEVRPFMYAAELLTKEAQTADDELQSVSAEEEIQRREAEALQEKLRKIEQEWQEVAPQIKSRVERLREVLNLEQESVKGHLRLSRLQTELQNSGEELARLQKQLDELEKLREYEEAEQERLAELRRDLLVEPQVREQVNQAISFLHYLEQARKTRFNAACSLEEKERELQTGEEELTNANRTYETLCRLTEVAWQESNKLKAELDRCLEPEECIGYQNSLEHLEQASSIQCQVRERLNVLEFEIESNMQEYRNLREQAQELEGKRNASQEAIRDLSRRYQREKDLNQAAHLAELLEEGEPCPVCGALDHPRPALLPGEDCRGGIEAEIARQQGIIEDIDVALAVLNTRLGAVQASLDIQEVQRKENQEKVETAAITVTAWLEKLPADLRGIDAEDARRWILGKRKDYEQKLKKSREQEQSLIELERNQGSALAEKDKLSGILAHARRLVDEFASGLERAIREEDELILLFKEIAQGMEPVSLQEQEKLIKDKDRQALVIENDWQTLNDQQQKTLRGLDELRRETNRIGQELAIKKAELGNLEQTLARLDGQIAEVTGGKAARDIMSALLEELQKKEQVLADSRQQAEQYDKELEAAVVKLTAARTRADIAARRCREAEAELDLALSRCHFASSGEARTFLVTSEEIAAWEDSIRHFTQEGQRLHDQKAILEENLQGSAVDPEQWESARERLNQAVLRVKDTLERKAVAHNCWLVMEEKNRRWREIEQEQLQWQEENNRLQLLQSTLKGKDFVKFIAGEQLRYICQSASLRLQQLSRLRYGLELDSENNFVIRDDHNGGLRRAVATLSGGETFLASLALALALSAQIQLRGEYPLEFFFLDEGFGTLDPDLLETVISSLESLRHDRFMVGVISHVPELQNRLPHYLQVIPSEPGGAGTQLRMN